MDAIEERTAELLLDGRYRLGQCLGRGGSAVVYRAEDTVLGRTVAIKLLGRTDEIPDAADRVRSETTVLASLNHPSLVTLYDARLGPGHAQYLAMEYVDGPTLRARLSDGPLPASEVAAFACDLAEALQVVHEAGIIHRDVKPPNILLASNPRRESGWTAKLTDFGIAFSLGNAHVTSPGVVVGTAAYMAPEQVSGADLTPAVDIYSLGLVLIEALTGEPAFPSDGTVHSLIHRLTQAPTVPDSIDPRWTALLTRMTRVRPEERPAAPEVAKMAAVLSDVPPLRDPHAAPRTATAVVTPITPAPSVPTQRTTAVQQSVPSPGADAPAARRRPRAAAASAIAAAAGLIALAGFWPFSALSDAPARTAGSVGTLGVLDGPVGGQEESPSPEHSPVETATESVSPASDSGLDEAKPGADSKKPPASDTGPKKPPTKSDKGPPHAPNPNKGPGNNSGNQGPPADKPS